MSDTVSRRRTLPLAAVLALSFGIVVVVGVFAVLLIVFSTSRTNTLDLLNDKSMLMVGLMKTGVRGHLDPAVNQAAFFDRQVRLGVVDLNDRETLGSVLLGALAAAPQINAVVFWDRDLQVTVARIIDGGQAVVERRQEDRGGPTRDLQRRAAASPEAFWGRLIFEPNLNVTIINLIQPLWLDGSMAGMIGIAMTMPELSTFITEVGDQFNATGFILYGDDQLLAHPNLTSGHPDLRPGSPTVGLNRVGDDVVANLRSGVPSEGFAEAVEAGVGIAAVTLAGVEHVVISGTLEDYGEVPLTVAAHLLVEQVDSELERLVWSFYAAAVVLVLSIIAAVIVGRALARPIRRAAVQAIQVGTLDLAAVAPMPASRVREFDDQAAAFNRMLAALKWFETYVPRSLVKRLVASGDDSALASGDRTLTILFSDIVGFTGMSEAMSAGEAATLLNEHFALLGGCVEAEGGTIDKFIGDGLMAFWGAPDEQTDHADRACRAACAIAAAVTAENEKRRGRGQKPVRVRLGVHTGSVMVGNIGAPGRINYTIVGDAVNTAQRFEGLGKELDEGDDVTVIISAATAAAVDMAGFRIEPAGRFEVKGKAAPLEVFRLGPTSGGMGC